MSIALEGHIGLAEETTFRTEVATPTHFIPIKGEGFNASDTLITPNYIDGNRAIKYAIQGNYAATGSMNFDLNAVDGIPLLFKGLFGQCTSTLVDTGVYDHVFTPKDSSILPSFTVEQDLISSVIHWLGTTFDSLSINAGNDGQIDCSANAQPAEEKIAASSTSPSFAGIDPFSSFMIDVTLNSSTDLDFESWDLTYTNNLEPVFTMDGSRFARRHVAKGADLSGNFTIEHRDDNERQRFYGSLSATGPTTAVLAGDLNFTITHATEIETGYYYTITIDIPKIVYNLSSAALSGPDARIMTAVAWTGLKESGSELITVTVRNGTASY